MARNLRAVRREAREHEEKKGWKRSYPDAPMVDAAFRLNAEARDALLRFRDEKPFALEGDAFINALKTLFRTLAHVYDMPEPNVWHEGEWDGDSGTSEYLAGQHSIVLRGKRSVLTALHEFAHARGYGETASVWWSVNAFRTTWPASYEKLAAKFMRRNGTIRPRGLRHVLCAKGRPLPVVQSEGGFVDLTRPASTPETFEFEESPEPGVRKVDLSDPAPDNQKADADIQHVIERAKRLEVD